MCFCSYKSAILTTKNYLAFSPIQSQKTLTLNKKIDSNETKNLTISSFKFGVLYYKK